MKARDFYKKFYLETDLSEFGRLSTKDIKRDQFFKSKIGDYYKDSSNVFNVALNHPLYSTLICRADGIMLLVKGVNLYVSITSYEYRIYSGTTDLADFAISVGKEIDDMDEDEINMIRMYGEML